MSRKEQSARVAGLLAAQEAQDLAELFSPTATIKEQADAAIAKASVSSLIEVLEGDDE